MSALEQLIAEERRAKFPHKHEVVEENGDRIYRRYEQGSTRTLKVWSWQTCRDKLRKAKDGGKLVDAFNALASQYAVYANGVDPMFEAWYSECFARYEKVYEELVAEDATVELFGCDDVEEFGA